MIIIKKYVIYSEQLDESRKRKSLVRVIMIGC